MRARYLLDTNVISNYSKGHPFVTPKLSSVPVKDVAVSVVTLMEIEFGLLCNPQMSQRTVSRTPNLLREVQVLSYEASDALEMARIRLHLERQLKSAQPIGNMDLLISSTARARGLICVTDNTAAFSKVPNLQLENWR